MSEDLIERQKAVDAVFELSDKVANEMLFIDAIVDKIENIPSAEPRQRWIPVTESLPEDGERVLITHKGGVSFGWYNGSYWERGAPTNHRPLQTVIAWMPLPEAYRGEDE